MDPSRTQTQNPCTSEPRASQAKFDAEMIETGVLKRDEVKSRRRFKFQHVRVEI